MHHAIDTRPAPAQIGPRSLLGLLGSFILSVAVSAQPVDVTTLGVSPGDGLNDSPAVTQALQDHDTLYFPPGEYDFFQTVFMPTGRTIQGAGPDQTRITLRADTVVFRVASSKNVTIADLSMFRPDGFDESREEMIFVYNTAESVTIRNVHALNNRSRAPAFSFLFSIDCTIIDCYVEDTQRRLFEMSDNDTALTEQVYGSGISFNSCQGVTVERNVVVETRDLTIDPAPAEKPNYYQAGAIQVSGCESAVIRCNRVETTGNGIDIGGTTGAIVENNVLDNCHETGIKMVNGTTAAHVRNNWLTRTGLIGIWLTPGSTDLAVVDCIVENNTISRVGQGIGGNGFWQGWFTSTVPAGIHIDVANSLAGRSHDNTIRMNLIHDSPDMVFDIILRPGNRQAYDITIEDNFLVPGDPADPQPCPETPGDPKSRVHLWLHDIY